MKAGRKLAHRSAGQGFSWEQYRPLADIVKIGEGVRFYKEGYLMWFVGGVIDVRYSTVEKIERIALYPT